MKTDGGLRPMFRERFRDWHWTSIETMTVNGVPDAEWCWDGKQGWNEYKFTNSFTVTLRPEQIGWALRRARAGGRSFIITRRTSNEIDELYIHCGADAGRLKKLGLKIVEPLGRFAGGPAGWNWERVSDLLLRADLPRSR
jgi:hypothetical protein